MKIANSLNNKGVSIIELILVTAVIGMLILLVSNAPTAFNMIGNSSRESKVREVIQKRIEDLRAGSYANLSNGTTQISDPRISTLPQGTSQVVINDCPITICTNGELAKLVEITVSWTESGKAKTVKTSTLVSQGGLN